MSNHAQKLLCAYVMVHLIEQNWPFPDQETLKVYNLLSWEEKEWLEENVELVEEGSMSPAYIKYAIVSVDGYYFRMVYTISVVVWSTTTPSGWLEHRRQLLSGRKQNEPTNQ